MRYLRHMVLLLTTTVAIFIGNIAISYVARADDQVTVSDLIATKEYYTVDNEPGNSNGPQYDIPRSVTIKNPLFINGQHTYNVNMPSSPVGLKCGTSSQVMATLLMNSDTVRSELGQGRRPDSVKYALALAPGTPYTIADTCPKLIDELRLIKDNSADSVNKVANDASKVILEDTLYKAAGAPLKDSEALKKFKNDPKTFDKWCSTSSQGVACSDDKWQEMLGRCVVEARGRAADAARYAGRQLTDEETNTSMQSFFAECLSQKLYGDSSKAGVIATELRSKKVNVMAAAIAGSDAKAAKAKDLLIEISKLTGEKNTVVDEEAKKSCGSEALSIGWFMCPLLSAAVGFADSMWSLFEGLLVLNPLQADANGYIYKTWLSFRDIANAALVGVFLFVVFSQVSNVGVSNYGVKKILPRLVLVAVGINVSFILVQVAVDLANILGGSILGLMNSAFGGGQIKDLSQMGWEHLLSDIVVGGLTTAGVAGAAIVGVTLAGPMASLIFVALMILPAIIGFIAGTLALMIRTAIIPVIAILAPLALVAYILPNTQGVFDKWRKTFTSLLMLYPLAAIYYGGLKLAALVMISDPKNGTLARLMGLTLLFVGTFVVCWLAIKANAITGKVAGSIQGGLNKMTAPMQESARDTATLMAAERRSDFMNQTHNPTGKKWYNPRRYGVKGLTGLAGRTMQKFDQSKRQRDLNTKLYGAARSEELNSALAANIPEDIKDTTAAKGVLEKIFKEEVVSAEAAQQGKTFREIMAIAKDMSGATKSSARVAALQKIAKDGSANDFMEVMKQSSAYGAGSRENQILAQGAYAKGFQGVLGADVGDRILSGSISNDADINAGIKETIKKGMNAENLVIDGDLSKRVFTVANSGKVDGSIPIEKLVQLSEAADKVITSEALGAKLKGDLPTTIDGISNL